MNPSNALLRAAILYAKYLIEKEFWNKNQKEIENNPFENTGGEIVVMGEDFRIEIKAYDWSKEADGYFKFYLFNVYGKVEFEFKWYKHCLRGLKYKCSLDRYTLSDFMTLLEQTMELYSVSIEEVDAFAIQEEMKRAINDPETIKRAAQGAIEQQKEMAETK